MTTHLIPDLCAIFARDLAAMIREVGAYPDEQALWVQPAGLPNTGGTLVRHVCGNLQHFIGATLGGTGYVRQRDAEFGAPPWSRDALLTELTRTEQVVAETLARVDDAQLAAMFPLPLGDIRVSTSIFLVHLTVHLGFHLGQLDYHRRAVTGDPISIAPMAVAALAVV